MYLSRIAGAFLALAFIAGCAGSNPNVGSSGPQGETLQAGTTTASRASHRAFHPMAAGSSHVYLANDANSTVTVYTPGEANAPALRTLKSGLSNPVSLAFDPSGDLFVANGGNNTVTEYAEAGPSPNTLGYTISNGIDAPQQLRVDGNGDLWVANVGNNAITEYAPGGKTAIQTITAGVDDPYDIALNSAGTNIAVSNIGNDNVTVYNTASGARLRTITDGISGPGALTYDASGKLYVANTTSNKVTEYAPGSITVGVQIAGLNHPAGLVIDNAVGDLWVADFGDSSLNVYAPSNGAELQSYSSTDYPAFNGVLRVVDGPPNSGYMATFGLSWLTTININQMLPDMKPHPSSAFAPTDEGLSDPFAVAFGP